MVVCKFFQQGYCRYGQNCRFEHVYGSKYSYHANPPASQTSSGITDEQLVTQVQSDIQSALKGSQWILSSYTPFKDKPMFPGITDLSPEEARLFIYEAKANNSLDLAINFMNNLYKETRNKYVQLLYPSPSIIDILRRINKGETVSSPFTDTTSGPTTNAASVFRSAAQSTSVFGANSSAPNTSVFGQQQTSIFASQSTDNSGAKSIFAQATQNAFGSSQTNFGQSQNTFGQSQTQSFGQNQSSNVFGSPVQDSGGAKSIFAQASQSIFGGNQPAQTPQNVFGNASQSFGSQTASSQNQSVFAIQKSVFPVQPNAINVFEQPANTNEAGVYSTMDDISQEDMEDFKSNEFKLGLIPEVPPPKALCFR
ncbi:nucleoporin NUP42-like [Achroia grisella]|uniref:nucleoporin NUP42-like n=1 Tax=Achroia grisella TaxID=688607 RepID=UPI0027D2E827|nr:nucleoporin NUP42-like [Achroia grisella]